MFDAKKLLDQFLGSQVPGLSGSLRDKAGQAAEIARNNPLKTGALAAAILGTETGRKLAGNAAALGGLAAIAGLGYLAYKNYQSGQAVPPAPQAGPELLPPPAGSPFDPHSPALTNAFALTLVQAMIAAAKADGQIDATERARIMEKIKVSGLDHEVEAFIDRELAAPLDLDALVAAAVTQEQKVELYTASRLAVDADSRAERGYLDLLAGRLGLPDALIDHIEATVSSARL